MLPWTTTAALEQRNDTKELTRVQRPLGAQAEPVDKGVTNSIVITSIR
jgi:hypothetical protein